MEPLCIETHVFINEAWFMVHFREVLNRHLVDQNRIEEILSEMRKVFKIANSI